MTDWKALSNERGILLREMSRRIEELETASRDAAVTPEDNEARLFAALVRVAELEAELRGKAATPWQPIETAPHGKLVLLGWRDWRDHQWCVEASPATTGQRFDNGYSNLSQHGSATHWMPLPEAPGVAQPVAATPQPSIDAVARLSRELLIELDTYWSGISGPSLSGIMLDWRNKYRILLEDGGVAQTPCPACNGNGVNANQPEGCTDCLGTGVDHYSTPAQAPEQDK